MKKISLTICAALLCAGLGAQNLNPTVTVTNDYEARAAAVDKKGVDMTVPDSLFRFDYKFDYSVFDSPYKGAYEFSPYSVKMTPSPTPYEGGTLYLRAGAGYTLRPELDVVWAPVVKDNFSMSVFGAGDGYLGPYSVSTSKPSLYDGAAASLYNFSDNAGVDFHWNLGECDLVVEAGHDGIFSSAVSGAASTYNSAYARANLKSDAATGTYFFYDLDLLYRFGHDGFSGAYSCESLNEHNLLLGGSVGATVDTDWRFAMDFEVEAENLSGDASATLMRVGATPRVLFTLGSVAMSAGVELGYSDAFRVYPDIRAEIALLDGLMTAYGDFIGGERINTWHSSKLFSHRLLSSGIKEDKVTFGRDRYDTHLGVRGYLSRFQYDVSAGFGKVENLHCDRLYPSSSGATEMLAWVDAHVLHADASLSWKDENFEADANLALCKDIVGDSESIDAYARPLLSADARFVYNWSKRIYAGLWCAANTARVNFSGDDDDTIPGWFDLGLYGRYRLNHKWSFWAQLGNLLGSEVRESAAYVRQGRYFTVGIGLNL